MRSLPTVPLPSRSPTSELAGKDRARYVQGMFGRIALRYSLLNHLMTAGQDTHWRQQVIRLARLSSDRDLLDLGTGTGELTREALRQQAGIRATAADFTLEMMRAGQRSDRLHFCAADALHLPFEDGSFDAIVSGFLMRNVIDLPQALAEQHRVLRSGGSIVILDTTRPKRNLFSPIISFHMHVVIPVLGSLISGAREAYNYLPDSTEAFLTAEDLGARLSAAGFSNIHYKILMFGTIAIHWGERIG